MRSFSFVAEKGIDNDNGNVRLDDIESSPQNELHAKRHPIEKKLDNLMEEEDEEYENAEIDEGRNGNR